MASSTHVNSDGSAFAARSRRTIVGTEVVVRHDRIPGAGGALLFIDGSAYLLTGGGNMFPIVNSAYSHAATDADAVRVALAFHADSYVGTLKHAEEEGIPVADCYGPMPLDQTAR